MNRIAKALSGIPGSKRNKIQEQPMNRIGKLISGSPGYKRNKTLLG